MAWAPTYAASADLRSYLRIGDNIDDPELDLAVESASRAIDHYTNRQFGAVAAAEERTYEVEWSRIHGKYKADIDDLSTTAGLTVTVSGSAVTTYTLLPRNATEKGRPHTRILLRAATTSTDGGPKTVLMDGVWGWSAVPDAVKTACLVQAARFFKRRDSVFGVAGSPEFGSELRLLAKVDPDVEAMLRDYRRDWPMVG